MSLQATTQGQCCDLVLQCSAMEETNSQVGVQKGPQVGTGHSGPFDQQGGASGRVQVCGSRVAGIDSTRRSLGC